MCKGCDKVIDEWFLQGSNLEQEHQTSCENNLPGRRWIRTLTSLSSELNTRLQRQTISAHANGPYRFHRLLFLFLTESKSLQFQSCKENRIYGCAMKIPRQMKSRSWKAFRSSDTAQGAPQNCVCVVTEVLNQKKKKKKCDFYLSSFNFFLVI